MEKYLDHLLKFIGIILILVGFVAAYYGPLEIYVFYLFSKGGRFYYDGFGIGSLWFALLVIQNIGYYIIAAICIPIGIGHLLMRRYTLTLTRLFLWFWLGSGILLAVNLMVLIPHTFRIDISRDVLITRLTLVGLVALTLLILLPMFALFIYYSKSVRSVFISRDKNLYWTERYPFTLLAFLVLVGTLILVLHIAIFFQGIFPLFGIIMFGRQSIYLISLCILVFIILTIGILRLKAWAFWGSLITLVLLSLSSYLTFSQHSIYDIVQKLDLPSYEIVMFNQLNLIHDLHLTSFIIVPLLIAIGLLINSKRYFFRIKDIS